MIKGDLFNSYTGITTSQAEGMNNLYKSLQDHRELPLDIVALGFLLMSFYYDNEIKRGFGNTGNYKLRPEFRSYFIDHRWIELRQVIEPSEIIAT